MLIDTPAARRHCWPDPLLLGALLLGVLLGVLLGGCGADKPASGRAGGGQSPVPVVTRAIDSGSLTVYLDALGTVTPSSSVLVRSRVDGQLLRVHFSEGEQVSAGDLLAEIDPRPFQVQLAQVRGQLARDEALLQGARVDLARYRELWQQDSIARQRVESQEALVAQYEGAVEAGRGLVDNARLQLEYASITAPVGGRVGLRQVDAGNVVHASDSQGLVLITQLQPIQVVFTLPEDALPQLLPRLQQGERLIVEAYDRGLSRRLAIGDLVSVDNRIDTATGSVRLKAQFDNGDSALFPNQFVNIRLALETLADAVLAPAAAIQRGTGGDFVYAVDDDASVRLQPVELGPLEGDRVVVTSGLAPGDIIVVEGVDRLRAGARVTPLESATVGGTPIEGAPIESATAESAPVGDDGAARTAPLTAAR